MRQKTIGVCGFFGKSNFGDDVLQGLLSHRLSLAGQHKIRVFSDHSQPGITDKEQFDRVTLDILVLGVGGIISRDYWALSDEFLDKVKSSEVQRLAFVNVNITPSEMSDDGFKQKLVKLNATWWVRDRYTYEALNKEGCIVHFLPDLLFTLEVQERAKKKQVAFFPNAFPVDDDLRADSSLRVHRAIGALKALAHHIDWLSDFGWSTVICPLQCQPDIDDRTVGATIASMCRKRWAVEWIATQPSSEDVLQLVSESSLVISMRFHATVAAIVAGVPFIDITHSPKNENLLNDLGLKHLSVPYGCCNHEVYVAATQFAELGHSERSRHLNSYRSMALSDWSRFDDEWGAFCS